MNVIIDPDGDREAWDPVLELFSASLLPSGPVKTVMPYPLIAEAYERAKELDAPVALVVGDGAGVAARLVAQGRAQRGVLLEPGLIGVAPDHLEPARRNGELQPSPDPDALEAYSQEIASDTWDTNSLG
ncbi:MAG: hypothetical protein L0G99_08845 [Propionibacteriales bacterium]|nr:hypothetical protein [Propionibacteriales bacterium]